MRFVFSKHITRVNRSLILLDWMFFLGWEMVTPILAIFLTRNLGGTIAQAGYVFATVWLTRAAFQIPVSLLLDRREGEADDFIVLVSSITIAGLVAIGYAFTRSLTTVFALQVVQGIRSALYAASWPTIFSRHLNHGNVSLQWSLDTGVLAIVSGVAGAAGGLIADHYGFRALFLAASALSFLALIPLFGARELLKKPASAGPEPASAGRRPATPE